MITVYFDMDGVLTDLDGWLAAKFGVEDVSLDDREVRGELIRRAVAIDPAFPAQLPPNRPAEFRWIMRYAAMKGCTNEILTSYGQAAEADLGAQSHVGKVRWLNTYYLSEFQDKVLTRFNGVQNCGQKALYANEKSLLIDDQLENVLDFIAAGGHAVLYEPRDHAESVKVLERKLKELCG